MINIYELRTRLGITVKEIAERSGLSVRMVYYYEKNTDKITKPVLDKLCIGLGIFFVFNVYDENGITLESKTGWQIQEVKQEGEETNE